MNSIIQIRRRDILEQNGNLVKIPCNGRSIDARILFSDRGELFVDACTSWCPKSRKPTSARAMDIPGKVISEGRAYGKTNRYANMPEDVKTQVQKAHERRNKRSSAPVEHRWG